MGQSKVGVPEVPEAPPPPKQAQDVTRAANLARTRQRSRLSAARGIRSTDITGGLTTAAPVAKKTLLGQ